MSTPYLGEIRMFSFGFPPKNWALCNGQILSIAQNQALFSLLGTFYGGDGVTTFALPNLQSSMPLGLGTAPSRLTYTIAQVGGAESVTLNTTQLPVHSHQVTAALSANSTDPAGGYIAGAAKPAFTTAVATTTMGSDAVARTGGNQPHDNMPPFTVVNFAIALGGVFPSRN